MKTMKTKVIEIPEGMDLVETENGFKFVKAKKKYPESWEELERVKGYWIHHNSDISGKSDYPCSPGNKYLYPTKEQAKASTALAQLLQLRDAYRDGWKPDWDDGFLKYCIRLRKGEWEKILCCETCSTFSFETQIQASHFLKHHIDLLNQVKPLFS